MISHGLFHCLTDHLVDGLAVAQADLLFGGMDVDINKIGRAHV